MAIGVVVPIALLMRFPGPARCETSRLPSYPGLYGPPARLAHRPVATQPGGSSRSRTVYGTSPRATRIAHHGTAAAGRDQEVTLSGAKIPF
jgi:hypothetical protein